MNKSVKVLLVLSGLLVLALYYAYVNWPRQSRVPRKEPSMSRPAATIEPRLQKATETPEVAGEKKEPAVVVSHNIFAPLFPPPAPPKKPPKTITPAKSGGRPSPGPVGDMVPPLPPPRPRPVFLGALSYEGGQKVFLSVAGEVYVLAPGERFGPGNAYRLLEISSQSLTIKHDEEEASQQIPIEEKPISMVTVPGSAPGMVERTLEPLEAKVPVESGELDEEVPIDEVNEK